MFCVGALQKSMPLRCSQRPVTSWRGHGSLELQLICDQAYNAIYWRPLCEGWRLPQGSGAQCGP